MQNGYKFKFMQDYIALRINADPCNETVTDLLAAFLCDVGYESFSADESGMTAYVRSDLYDEDNVKEILSDFPMETKLDFSAETVHGEDWNEEWEKNYFKPIIVDGRCVVHSSFHKDIPVAEYDIVIDPKMAFGTGHHSTTGNMMRFILSEDMKGKNVIDMGTGTGILSILCKMRGADKVTGIEIDPFAWENAVENVRLNGVAVDMICGDASALEGLYTADYFLANINRNVITSDVDKYARKIKVGGIMLLSGFYRSDIPVVLQSTEKFGFTHVDTLEENDWVAIKLVKNA